MTLKRRTTMTTRPRHRADQPSALEVEEGVVTFHAIRPDGSLGGDRYEPFPTGYTFLSGPAPSASMNMVGKYKATIKGLTADFLAYARSLFRPYEKH